MTWVARQLKQEALLSQLQRQSKALNLHLGLLTAWHLLLQQKV